MAYYNYAKFRCFVVVASLVLELEGGGGGSK